MTIEELQVLITAETKGLRKELADVKKQFNSVNQSVGKATAGMKAAFKKVALAIASVFAVQKIIDFGKTALTAVGELQGAILGLQSILEAQGRSFTKANRFIQEYISDGLVPLTDAVTAYKNLTARGYNDEQIQQVMTRLKDSAAFGRQASYTLGEAVRSATEGLKNENSILVDNAGVTKNVAKMWDEYARSIGKNAQQLTKQEKIQAEVNGILKETQFQVGDAAKYADTYNGQLSALSKILQDIRVNLGQAFLPIAMTVMPLLQDLGNRISQVTAKIAQFSQALFGKVNVGKVTIGEQTDAIADQTEAVEDLGDATAAAGKKAKGALAGFDEVNTLSLGGATSGSGGSSVEAPQVEAPDVTTETGNMTSELVAAAEKLREILSPLSAALGNLKTAISNLGTAIKNNSIIQIFFSELKKTLANLGTGLVLVLAGAFNVLAGAINIVAGVISGDFETVLTGIEQVVSGVFDVITGVLYPIFPGIAKKLQDFKKYFGEKWASLKDDIKKYGNPTKLEAMDFALYIRDKVSEKWEELKSLTAEKWNGIKTAISERWAVIKSINWDDVKSMVLSAWEELKITSTVKWDELKTSVQGVWEDLALNTQWASVKETVVAIWADLQNATYTTWDYIQTKTIAIWAAIGNFLSVTWDAIKLKAEDIWNGIKTFLINTIWTPLQTNAVAIFTAITNGITTIFTAAQTNIMNTWNGIATGLTSVWNGIKTTATDVWNGIWTVIKGVLNHMITGINKFIDAWNRIKIEVPAVDIPLVGTVGGFTVSVPRIANIPMLAKGGIIDEPTLAMLGDRGKEAVVPLENTAFVDTLAGAIGSAVLAAMQISNPSSSQGQSGNAVIQIDGKLLARILFPYLVEEEQRIGTPILQPL